MAIKMVREPSETPNINNIDDIIPMRYAYGGQNGFVIGKGTEISNTVSGLNFTVNSGRLVLQGVECDIDATGVTITIDNIATKRYYTIYLEVNLGLNTATIKSEYDTATYPTIDTGDDLTENSTGIARLPLYRFTATSGIISDVNKVVESIKYINSSITVDNSKKVNNLEIKRDENGILNINDIIISQKKLIFDQIINSGTSNDGVSFTLMETCKNGDVVEIYMGGGGTGLGLNNIIKARIDNDNITYSYITFGNTDPKTILFISGNIRINGNQITLYPAIMSIKVEDTMSSSGIPTTNTNISISKIYKIIE
mgnify:CR=1 FL=1